MITVVQYVNHHAAIFTLWLERPLSKLYSSFGCRTALPALDRPYISPTSGKHILGS